MILAASVPVKLYLQYFVVACLSGFYCQFGLCSPFSDGFKKNIFSQFAQNFSFKNGIENFQARVEIGILLLSILKDSLAVYKILGWLMF